MDDYEPVSDYDDQMEYMRLYGDEDDYDRTHCKHGSFVGYPGGPDYMCGACEDGVSDEEWQAGIERYNRRLRRQQLLRPRLKSLVERGMHESPIPDGLIKRVTRMMHYGVPYHHGRD